MRHAALLLAGLVLVWGHGVLAADSQPTSAPAQAPAQAKTTTAGLEDFASLDGWKVWDKAWGGVASYKPADSAPAGMPGALDGHFPGILYKELTPAQTDSSAAWKDYAGLSFWVKGDGSDLYGCLAIGPAGKKSWEQNFNQSTAYSYYFPLKDRTWHKITVGWSDFVPEETQAEMGTPGGMSPADIRVIRVGNRWKIHHARANIPAHSYALAMIQFETNVPPRPSVLPLADFKGVLTKLKLKKPVRILGLGDSISAGHSVNVAKGERYTDRACELLKKAFGYPDITLVCRAVDAARISDARCWVQRDYAGDPPDLAVVMYGTNDSVVFKPKDFARLLEDYLDRVAVATRGRTAVLLLTTIPGGGDRFHTADPMAQVIREVAAKRHLPCCDLQKAMYSLGDDKMKAIMNGGVHPNTEGHQVMAQTLADYIIQAASASN